MLLSTDQEDARDAGNQPPLRKPWRDPHHWEKGISSALNAEVGAVLAALRQPPDPTTQSDRSHHRLILIQSLQSLRSFVFCRTRVEWQSADPSAYLSPFLNIIQSDDVPAYATCASLSAVLTILRLDIPERVAPGAREAVHALISAIANCRLELSTDPSLEHAVLLHILEILAAIARSDASVLLTDHAVCSIVSSCFQILQQSADGDHRPLQSTARRAMLDVVCTIFSRLPSMRSSDGNEYERGDDALGYTAQCMIDIFHFLCSLLSSAPPPDAAADGDELLQFTLSLVHSAIELGGSSICRHPGLLHLIQDQLFRHLISHAARSTPPLLSLICSIALDLYQFLRRFLRLQLEAFFVFALLKLAGGGEGNGGYLADQVQEVAVEGIVSFCRQPAFIMEAYVNYDCDPILHNVWEEIGELLCKAALPNDNTPMSSIHLQAFQGLVAAIGSIANGIEIGGDPADGYGIDESQFNPFWIERCDARKDDSESDWVEFVRIRKLKKKRIAIAASHYNRDEKKGVEFLRIRRLVQSPTDAQSLACFFRYTPGLDKNKIGDYLGDPSELNVSVLKEFAATFEFSGVLLDTALRTFLDAFRLPGESQKIHRILETFSDRFYEQQQQSSSEIFASKDAVFILCYSLIMLNTDQHNPQVKKKMTEEEFIKNNRAINGGMDLPRDYLSELFHSISTNAIMLAGGGGGGGAAPSDPTSTNHWADLMKRSRAAEPFICCDYKHKLCREAFMAVAGPSVCALSAVFEQTNDEEVLRDCVEALLSVAHISRHGMEDVLDEVVSCFCRFTALLNPYASAEETIRIFSDEIKPRMATLAVFTIANKLGDSIRGSWRNIIDCVLKLKRLKLLPPAFLQADAIDGSNNAVILFPSSHPSSGAKNASGLVGRFSQLFLSLEAAAESMQTPIGNEAEKNAKLMRQCQIERIFTASASSLPPESLQNLLRALVFTSIKKGQKFSTPAEEEEAAGFCWDLIVVTSVSNLPRLGAFWPQLHDSLVSVSQLPLFSPSPFVEKALVALLKIAARILRMEERQAEESVFRSMNLVWKLDKEAVDACSEAVAEAAIKMLNENPGSLRTALGWKTLFQLLSVAGRHQSNFHRAVKTLVTLMTRGFIDSSNYSSCIDAVFGFAVLKISPMETSSRLLDLMAASVDWILDWWRGTGENDDEMVNLFMKLADSLRKTSLVRREEIRNQAVAALGRCFLAAAEGMDWTAGGCASRLNLVIFAMVDDLNEKVLEYARREKMERETRSMEGTLMTAAEMMVEVYLRFMDRLAAGPGFRATWLAILRRMDTIMKAGIGDDGRPSQAMQELVPALLSRMIAQMKEKKVLANSPHDDLWEITRIQIQWIIAASANNHLLSD